jgi:hypothetical protein
MNIIYYYVILYHIYYKIYLLIDIHNVMDKDSLLITVALIVPLLSVSLVMMNSPAITPAFAAGTFSQGWKAGESMQFKPLLLENPMMILVV